MGVGERASCSWGRLATARLGPHQITAQDTRQSQSRSQLAGATLQPLHIYVAESFLFLFSFFSFCEIKERDGRNTV